MAKLIFSSISSLDGYMEDVNGDFTWGQPDEEVLRFINELESPIGTYLYGRRMYETMVFWETADSLTELDSESQEFGKIWRSAHKVVYSRSLSEASSAKTRIQPVFNPTEILEMKSASERDITVGGPTLAAQAFRAGLVDECQLFLMPVVVGGGKPALPADTRLNCELIDERKFESGVVFLHYRTSTEG